MHNISFDQQSRKTAIKGIVGFSALDFFGETFQLRPALVSKLTQVEAICQEALNFQLQSDFAEINVPSKRYVLLESVLKSHLSQIFPSSAKFWSHYYSMIERSTTARQKMELSADVIEAYAEDCYPTFFLPHEVMRPGPLHNVEFQLTHYSMRAYLKARLYEMVNQSDHALHEYRQAVQFIGPLKVPSYRSHLQFMLEMLLEK